MMCQGRTQQQQEQNGVLIAWMSDVCLVEIDIKKVGKYVKSDLFEQTIFLWEQKALEVDGVLHKDYITNCKSLNNPNLLVEQNDRESMLQKVDANKVVKLVPGLAA
jgi:hypothetical protein